MRTNFSINVSLFGKSLPKFHLIGLTILLLLCLLPKLAFAQDEEPALELRLSRDNGFGLGSQMQGHFSYRVSGPDDLVRVEFLMDGEVIGEDTAEPFRLNFVTDNYSLGFHEMSAVGYTSGGQVLQSRTITGQFVDPGVTSNFTTGIIIFVVVVVVARILFTWQGKGKTKKGYGFMGGAVCANCGRPFAIHWWSPHLLTTRLDRCPHCGKWQNTRRATAEMLVSAETFAAELDREGQKSPDDELDAQEKLRRQIEESRFDDRS